MKRFFQDNDFFRSVYVKGEVSGYKKSQIGHIYFSLKDKSSVVPCILNVRNQRKVDFEIRNGMKLLVIANVTVYKPHGKYQLDVFDVAEDGLGRLYVKFQQLKEKLTMEGLFSEEFKKPLPRFPKRIGVVTSRDSAVIHDIIKTVRQKWPYCQVILFPASVQGPSSKNELTRQIRRTDSFNLDVLIVARGGGSIEELWAFNEEEVVRAIFNCRTPVISAVGHESDVTLTDFVADMRASTPTMAASMAVENKSSIMKSISQYHSRLITFMSSKMDDYKRQMNHMLDKSLFSDSQYVYKSRKASFDELHFRFDNVSGDVINSNRAALDKVTSQYVIKHPCKMQLDTSRSNLNELQNRLLNSMENILKTNRVNLDKATKDFNFLSKNMLMTKRHELDMVSSTFSENLCLNMIDASRNDLKLINDRVVSQVNGSVWARRRNLDKAVSDFTAVSNSLIISKRHELDLITSTFSENLCLNMIDASRNDLKLINDSVVSQVNGSVWARRRNLDRAVSDFTAVSNSLVISKRHEFDLITSTFSESLCLNKISEMRIKLNTVSTMISALLKSSIDDKCRIMDKTVSDFTNASQKIILDCTYRLDSLRNNSAVKNPERIYESKRGDLTQIRNNKIIKNPYLILEPYRNELKIQEEKLDKINSVIMLKQEQKQQKQTYIKIIAVIVAVMIIILIVILGGIL